MSHSAASPFPLVKPRSPAWSPSGDIPVIANPKFISATAHVDEAAVQPLPNSRKIYVTGSRDDLRVPMRAISQADTPSGFGGEKNPPVYVYDTSGPYTDPTRASTSVRACPRCARAGSPSAATLSSSRASRARSAANATPTPATAELRFPNLQRTPRRALAGRNVTQMHYARQGIITPEMEFVAIRENQRRAEYLEGLRDSGPQGAKLARADGPPASGPELRRGAAARDHTRIRARGNRARAARSSRTTSTTRKRNR